MNALYERHIRFHDFLRAVVGDCAVAETMEQPSEERPASSAQDARRTDEMPAEMLPLLQDVLEQLDELERQRSHSLRELQQVAVELSVIVASYVVQKDLSEDSHGMNQLVQMAIERLVSGQSITFRLHPDDLSQLESLWKSAELEMPQHAVFKADPSLSRGSCLADTPDYGLLSTLDARIEEIRQALVEGIKDAQIERRRTGEASQGMRRFPDRRETA